jgi:hypothetical protein
MPHKFSGLRGSPRSIKGILVPLGCDGIDPPLLHRSMATESHRKVKGEEEQAEGHDEIRQEGKLLTYG